MELSSRIASQTIDNSILIAAWAVGHRRCLPPFPREPKGGAIRHFDGGTFACNGQQDRGDVAYKLTLIRMYDPLVAWEMDCCRPAGKLVPGLATEWKVDGQGQDKWRLRMRQGVQIP